MDMTINFSVVVPVYKIDENRLKDCIESLKAQHEEDVEFIIVDDGSPDNCGEICDKLTKDDLRFNVIHSENRGVSHARNLGIKAAKGEFIIFVDGDDQLLPGAVSICKEYENHDLVLFDYCINGQHKKISNKQIEFIKQDALAEIQASFIGGPSIDNLSYTGAPWGKIYRKSIINNNNCYFDEKLPRSQDNEFNFRYMNYVKRCLYVEKEIYNYTVNSNSAMRKYWKKAFENSTVLLDTISCELSTALNSELCRTAFWNFAFSKLRDVIDTNVFHGDNKLTAKERIYKLRATCESQYYSECIREKKVTGISYDNLLLVSFKLRVYHLAGLLIRLRRLLKRL